MTVYFVLLLLMTILGSVASLFLKRATDHDKVIQFFTDINLYIGAGLYLASAILNIIVLRRLDYSLVLPLTSITYIWTILISYLLLNEQITKKKVGGIIFILIGAVCISR